MVFGPYNLEIIWGPLLEMHGAMFSNQVARFWGLERHTLRNTRSPALEIVGPTFKSREVGELPEGSRNSKFSEILNGF